MVYKIIWAENALQDLRQIVHFVLRQNPIAAHRIGEDLIFKAESLVRFPERGRMIKKFDNINIRELISPPFRIAYRIDDSEMRVEILRIWHGARNDENLTM